MDNSRWSPSVKKAIAQYNTARKAERFSLRVGGTATDRREKRCIAKALSLANVPPGPSVLDLPCGAGRLLPLLKKLGYTVTAADVSTHMLAQARRYAGELGENCLDETDSFLVANIFHTGFEDNSFDAVICHRLLQYFFERKTRQQALRELGRICRGPIVVSFLCNLAADAVAEFVASAIRRRKPRGCTPISYAIFAEDARAAGLAVKRWIPMRPLVSKRWFVVLQRDTVACGHPPHPYYTIARRTLGRVAAVAATILIGLFVATHLKPVLDPHEYTVEKIARQYQDGNDHFYVSANPCLEDLCTGKNLSLLTSTGEVSEKMAVDYAESQDSFFLLSSKALSELRNSPVLKQLVYIKRINIWSEEFVLFTTEGTGAPTAPRTQEYSPIHHRVFAIAKTPCTIGTASKILV